MKREIKILPATVRVENIDLLDFLSDLQEILKSVPELLDSRASGVSVSTPRGTISMSYVSPNVFNLSGPDPETLNKFMDAMKNHYASKTK